MKMEAEYSSETFISNKLHGVASHKTAISKTANFEQDLYVNLNYRAKVEAKMVSLAVLGP
jgi:hypothetical protein